MSQPSQHPARLPPEVAARFMPLVQRTALSLKRRLPAHVSVDDLVGAGMLGLVDAYRLFDPPGSGNFERYVGFRIRGAMLDELRAHDPLPRYLRTLERRRSAAIRGLFTSLGRVPSDDEIAAALGLDLEGYQRLAARLATEAPISLDALADGESAPIEIADTARSAQETLLDAEERAMLAQALQALPERLGRVIGLYYGDSLTLRDIGRLLGVNESRVCQLRSDAVRRLREKCAEAA